MRSLVAKGITKVTGSFVVDADDVVVSEERALKQQKRPDLLLVCLRNSAKFAH